MERTYDALLSNGGNAVVLTLQELQVRSVNPTTKGLGSNPKIILKQPVITSPTGSGRLCSSHSHLQSTKNLFVS